MLFELPSEIDGRVWDCGQHPGCLGVTTLCAALLLPFRVPMCSRLRYSPRIATHRISTHSSQISWKDETKKCTCPFERARIHILEHTARGIWTWSELFVGRVGLGGFSSTHGAGGPVAALFAFRVFRRNLAVAIAANATTSRAVDALNSLRVFIVTHARLALFLSSLAGANGQGSNPVKPSSRSEDGPMT